MLLQKGGSAWREQRFDDARVLFEHALLLAREVDSPQGTLSARHMLANIAFNQCEDEKSRAMHEELLAECRASGFNGGIASSLANLALIDVAEGKFDDAQDKYEQAISLYEADGYTEVASSVRQTLEELVVQRKPLTVPRKARKSC